MSVKKSQSHKQRRSNVKVYQMRGFDKRTVNKIEVKINEQEKGKEKEVDGDVHKEHGFKVTFKMMFGRRKKNVFIQWFGRIMVDRLLKKISPNYNSFICQHQNSFSLTSEGNNKKFENERRISRNNEQTPAGSFITIII